MLKHDVYTVKG